MKIWKLKMKKLDIKTNLNVKKLQIKINQNQK